MKDIATESLFYTGGTIQPEAISKAAAGNFAINNDYIFFANNHNFKAVKYEINSEYSFKLLKTKIKIISPEAITRFLTDPLFRCYSDKIFNHFLNEVKK